MGKSDSTVRQRKERSNRADDNSDDDVLLDGASSLDKSRRKWQIAIAILVLLNAPLGYVHFQRFHSSHKTAGVKEVSFVKVLSDSTLPDHIANHRNGTLVYFHATGCAQCEKLAPEFEHAAKTAHGSIDTSFVSVDAALAPQAAKLYSVTTLPTMLWFRRGELVQNVPQSIHSTWKIVEFVDQSLQASVINFSSRKDFDEAVPKLRSVLNKGAVPVFVGFGHSGVYEALQQAGEKFRGLTAFLYVTEAHADEPYIRAYFSEADADHNYNSTLGSEELQSWLQPFVKPKSKNQTVK